jgi:hypothetical protein
VSAVEAAREAVTRAEGKNPDMEFDVEPESEAAIIRVARRSGGAFGVLTVEPDMVARVDAYLDYIVTRVREFQVDLKTN